MESDLFEQDHEDYREVAREFVRREVEPNLERWEEQRLVDRDVWAAAGKQGLLGLQVPEEYGGPGVDDFRFRVAACTEIVAVGAASLQSGFATNDDIVLGYLLGMATEEQKARWLPGFVTGETIGAIAMTEPGAGSDLRGIRTSARRDGDEWVIDGSKTFITNGILADLVVVVAQTDPEAGSRGFTLFVVETGTEGFRRGRKLDKVGLAAQDTAELFFDGVRVPDTQRLGEVGTGLQSLMANLPRERLGIAMSAQTTAEAILEWTLEHVTAREAFGKPLSALQTVSHTVAELRMKVEVSRAYFDRCVRELNAGTLTAVDAAKAKWWATEMQWQVVDAGVQLHGGYGYMNEYAVARAFRDARVQRIYGGSNEVMKEIVARDLTRAR
ncbi:acyl-CoA dehydrogenase family protein [Actinomycetospora sp. TBRC 11914]|uniref:acyl-CoA dehydrogenase family protein n=1 Tax=Actinomycetospora sp. TBRC 11914 TaxID=2729387 RepID=UPI00145F49C6|nr:acyl-CoA dehydrogenase family protein [Actinomycetospora sp. TBRC 11914]NMO91601.1 acyl-CoA dehydrogenase [Actinomycetospora sp. TBRC 11914]